MMLFAAALAAVVAVVVTLSGNEDPAPAVSAEPQAVEAPVQERAPDNDSKPRIEDKPQEEQPRPDQPRREKPETSSNKPESSSKNSESLPVRNADWPAPDDGELAQLDEPRYFEPVSSAVMTLTIEALSLYDVPVISSDSPQALDLGIVHVPGTSFPWDGGAQRNVYLAGHRYGYYGTGSRLVFYELDALGSGDVVSLEDREGQVYKYRVSEALEVGPDDYWVMDQVVGRDLLTLQTCTGPNFEKRLIVRAERV